MSYTIQIWTPIVALLLFASNALALTERKFVAARRSPHLRRKSLDFEASDASHMLLFEDESSPGSAARVHLTPKYPTLVLDDIYDHIKDVVCSTNEMVVFFHNTDVMYAAAKAWIMKSNLTFVSTHATCVSHGSYEPFLLKYVSADAISTSITFEAKKQTFKETTHRISVDLGHHVLEDIDTRIARRQASSTVGIAQTPGSNTQSASLSPTVSFDFVSPTGTPVSTKTTNDISFSRVNKAVLPPDQLILDLFPGTQPLSSVYLGCKSCSLEGTLALEAAGFEIDSTVIDQAIDFFDNGYLQFTASKLKAHVELEIGLLPGFSVLSFVANLTRIPLSPISIPKIIKLGPAIELSIPMGIELNSPLNFSTGFELTVPDDSKIILNVSDTSNSSQTGFDKTSFKALPFSTKAEEVNLNLTTSLKPKLVISAGAGSTAYDVQVEGGVGAYLDFPKLIANVVSMKNTNSTCNGPASKGTTNRAIRVILKAVFGLGLHWGLGFELPMIPPYVRGGEQELASASYDLPSQCLIFDAKRGSAGADSPGNVPTSDAGSSNVGSSTRESMSRVVFIMLLTTGICMMLW